MKEDTELVADVLAWTRATAIAARQQRKSKRSKSRGRRS